jgi:hypothetical protein
MTTYLASHALEQLAEAQAIVDRHLAVGTHGRCFGCGQPEPCDARRRASAVFARYRRLPRRRPGLASAGVR